MKVFISYSSESRELADRLRSSLAEHKIEVWSDNGDDANHLNWADRIEQAVTETDAIIVLVEPNPEPDERQRRTWQIALEAVWADPNKRLIPFLLKDVEPPSFTRASISAGENLAVVRAKDPNHDWDCAVSNLVALLHKKADPSQIEQVPAVTEKDIEQHRIRRSQITAYVENLKSSMNLPDNPEEWKASRSQR